MASAKADAAAKPQPRVQEEGPSEAEPVDMPYSPSAAAKAEDDADLPDLVNLIGSSEGLARKQVQHAALTLALQCESHDHGHNSALSD